MKLLLTLFLCSVFFVSCSSQRPKKQTTYPNQSASTQSIDFKGKTTRSGLKYQVIREGRGRRPNTRSTVTVHYRGTLLSGKEFDSSYKRNRPATFQLTRVIPGWTEGLQLMKPGAKYRFLIPSHLAYGARGTRGIPPYSTLIFEVELLAVK